MLGREQRVAVEGLGACSGTGRRSARRDPRGLSLAISSADAPVAGCVARACAARASPVLALATGCVASGLRGRACRVRVSCPARRACGCARLAAHRHRGGGPLFIGAPAPDHVAQRPRPFRVPACRRRSVRRVARIRSFMAASSTSRLTSAGGTVICGAADRA